MNLQPLTGAVAAAVLAGCAVGPDYEKPQVALPESWHEAAPTDASVTAADPSWWKAFGDPLLDELIAEAAHANLGYLQALDRIRQARSQRTIAIAAGLPDFSARSTVMRRRNSISGLGGQTGNTSMPFGGFGGGGNTISNLFQAAFDASWEIDLFGAVRRGIESASANLEAERENSRDVLVTLLGEVARTYIDLRQAQRQTAITRTNLQAQEETLELTRARATAGLAAELDVVRAEQLVDSTRAQLPSNELAAKQAEHALAVLLGKPPGALSERLWTPGMIPQAPESVALSLPPELLQRRPDLRRAERQLAAATADIGIAKAEQFPRINLSALLGVQNLNLAQMTPVGKSWSLAATATMPIFNWGRIRANIESKEARRDELRHAYEAAVLTALRDVEDALAAYTEESQRTHSLQRAKTAADTAVTLAKERYYKGLSDFLDVLDAQRSLLVAESELAVSQAQASAYRVSLYKALGGGWGAWES